MNSELFLRVKELFVLALPLELGERRELLDRECGEDHGLRTEVEELLAHAEAASPTFLGGRAALSRAALQPGRLAIPGFSDFELLGAGATGVIYRAWQQNPRREVAVKVLRLDSLEPGHTARFRREAEVLGTLNHPGIAHVHEAGVVDGEVPLPWIAMEFVRGRTLDHYVIEEGPELRSLLDLFRTLSEAVQHAHEKGIVHRDLKPSNVMVDEAGRPKVLDFGTARALTGLDAVRQTRTGVVIGTLAYMAPEQGRGERSLDARADVYALGAMLFECLTGRLPLDIDGLDTLDALRVIGESDPLRARRLRPELNEDLELILMKALEKEPERRYANAGEFAADIGNFLADRPVLARRPTTAYQVQKFVRRNRALTASATVVLLALIVGLVFALWSLRAVRVKNASTSDALDFFASRLVSLSPELGFGEEQRPVLEALLARIEVQLRSDPGNRALRAAAAQDLYELGSLDQARGDHLAMQEHIVRAVRIREQLVNEDASDLESWTHLAQLYARSGEARHGLGDLDGWATWSMRALELGERLVRENPGNLELVEDLGWSLGRMVEIVRKHGENEQAEAFVFRRLEEATALVQHDPDNWKYLFNLSDAEYFAAVAYREQQEPAKAYEHFQECTRLARRTCELQPKRRDFLYSFAQYSRAAREAARVSGDSVACGRFAEETWQCSLEVALGDPGRERHLLLLRGAAAEYVQSAHDQGKDVSPEVVRWLRRVAELARRQIPESPETERVAVTADQIEEAARQRRE